MKPKVYKFKWGGKKAYIAAFTYSSARRQFAKKHGFYPDESRVQITRES